MSTVSARDAERLASRRPLLALADWHRDRVPAKQLSQVDREARHRPFVATSDDEVKNALRRTDKPVLLHSTKAPHAHFLCNTSLLWQIVLPELGCFLSFFTPTQLKAMSLLAARTASRGALYGRRHREFWRATCQVSPGDCATLCVGLRGLAYQPDTEDLWRTNLE